MQFIGDLFSNSDAPADIPASHDGIAGRGIAQPPEICCGYLTYFPPILRVMRQMLD